MRKIAIALVVGLLAQPLTADDGGMSSFWGDLLAALEAAINEAGLSIEPGGFPVPDASEGGVSIEPGGAPSAQQLEAGLSIEPGG